MLVGAMNIARVIERSNCRSTEDYYFSTIGDYRIHSSTLLPHIPFEKSKVIIDSIDNSIFINVEKTKLTFPATIKTQNYLTTRYIGRAPLEYYGPKTKMGKEFILICEAGDSEYNRRYFGTQGAIGVTNPNVNELVTMPR